MWNILDAASDSEIVQTRGRRGHGRSPKSHSSSPMRSGHQRSKTDVSHSPSDLHRSKSQPWHKRLWNRGTSDTSDVDSKNIFEDDDEDASEYCWISQIEYYKSKKAATAAMNNQPSKFQMRMKQFRKLIRKTPSKQNDKKKLKNLPLGVIHLRDVVVKQPNPEKRHKSKKVFYLSSEMTYY